MKFILAYCLILISGGSLSAAERGQDLAALGRVEVSAQVEAGGKKKLKLEDIAQISNVPAEVEKELRNLDFAEAPGVSEKSEYSNLQITEIFRSGLARIQEKYAIRLMFKVPQMMILKNSGYVFNQEAIRKQLLSLLRKDCAECDFELTFNLPQISPAAEGLPWRLDSGNKLLRGRFSLPVFFAFSEKDTPLIFWVSGNVTVLQKVPVATRQLALGESLKADDYQWKFRDVTFATDGIPAKNELDGKKIRQGLRIDEIIWKNSLERQRALRFGDVVSVVLGDDSWEITTSAVAQGNGDIGDEIRLLNPQTKKIYIGKITGDRRARISR